MFTKSDIEKYFNAEKNAGFQLVIIGFAGLIAAAVFFFVMKPQTFLGAAIPAGLLGIIQVMVGYNIYIRSDKQRIDIAYKYDLNPVALKTQEVPRMEQVLKNFPVYTWVERTLLLASLFLIFYFGKGEALPDESLRNSAAFWVGFGWSLAIESIALLIIDHFGESRGRIYLTGLKKFLNL